MSKPILRLFLALIIGPLISISLAGQSPTRFQAEIDQFKADLADGLHMNRKGYDIWKEAVNGFLSKKLRR